MSADDSTDSTSSSPSESPPPLPPLTDHHPHLRINHVSMGLDSQSAFMRRSFHKNPRLPGSYRLSKLNGSSRNSYADSESENDLPDNAIASGDVNNAVFSRGSTQRQSITSMRSLPARMFDIHPARHERRRAIIPISTKMASRVISNATGDLGASHVDCRDFTTIPLALSRAPSASSSPRLHRNQRIVEEVEVPSFVTFKPPYGRSSICSSDDCSTSECSSSPHSTVRRTGTSSSPDLLKSSLHWFKDPACRLSMSSQSSWFSDDELYSMRSK
ncbi:uncharacterized protein LOC100901545 [Galendromus occidentalis]|uniref:Uncharacterized protein LOC100901545 n=1 Tax=Galendromus occidentalis TaxID=34638 RepID=A0AAJ7SGL6_9ACAR|nr:uncharacterized protein LOC100901545 [Galendromus occidentalis]